MHAKVEVRAGSAASRPARRGPPPRPAPPRPLLNLPHPPAHCSLTESLSLGVSVWMAAFNGAGASATNYHIDFSISSTQQWSDTDTTKWSVSQIIPVGPRSDKSERPSQQHTLPSSAVAGGLPPDALPGSACSRCRCCRPVHRFPCSPPPARPPRPAPRPGPRPAVQP